MELNINYRPANVEFDVAHDGSLMPENFGEYKDEAEVITFINENLIAIPYGITVARHMDSFEKSEMRKEYNDILENILPSHERRLSNASNELEEAKKKHKEALELVNSAFTTTKEIAREVKRGLKEMNLDEQFTYRVAFKGRYYIYTYIDKQLKLCKIKDIPESEKTEIWNQMAKNEQFVETYFAPVSDEPIFEKNDNDKINEVNEV